jgi:hypothetical protein
MGNRSLEAARRTSAYVRLAYPTIDAQAAVTAAGNIDLRGASEITGANTDPSLWTSCDGFGGGEIHAIRVPPTAVVSFDPRNLTGTLDVRQDPAAADEDTYVRYGSETWNSLVANADVRLAGGTVGADILPSGSATTCTMTASNWIIYSSGDLTLNGRGRGQGILLVNGDLTINGSFDFYGVIIARDDIERGTGTANIHGAVFSRNVATDDDTFFAGTQNVNFSRCAVENALRGSAMLTRVKHRHWTQLY